MNRSVRVATRLALIPALVALLALPAAAGRSRDDRDDERDGWRKHRSHHSRHARHHTTPRRAKLRNSYDRICQFLLGGVGDAVHVGFEGYDADAPASQRRVQLMLLLIRLLDCEIPEPDPQDIPPTPAPPPDTTLMAEGGTALADLGRVEVDDGRFRVPFATPFLDPVVILGPPSERDAEPGVARIDAVESDGFVVRFAEWPYLDGAHAAETLSYLVLAPGRHVLADGSIWEVGTLELKETGVWSGVAFSAAFDATPAVFLTAQGGDPGEDPVVARARDVDETGFQAALFEEEASDGAHGIERIGWLAVHAPARSGRLDAASGSLPYRVESVQGGDRSVPVLFGALRLEEETSADVEVEHVDETLAFLALGPHVFAGDQTSGELDTASLRFDPPEHGAAMEWGTVSDVDTSWVTVPLARGYTDPVVVAGPMSSAAPERGVVRIRNVRPDAFELRVQSWSHLGALHGPERVFYLVTDPGLQSLGGLEVQAGRVDTAALLREDFEDVVLPLPQTDVPAVFASVTTQNSTPPVTVRISQRAPTGFQLSMQQEEANRTPHEMETVGWIAIQPGQATTTDGRSVQVFDTLVDDAPVRVPFLDPVRRRFPSLVGQIGSTNGLDPAVLRYRGVDADGVELVVEEDQSLDDETTHFPEDVSVFVAE